LALLPHQILMLPEFAEDESVPPLLLQEQELFSGRYSFDFAHL